MLETMLKVIIWLFCKRDQQMNVAITRSCVTPATLPLTCENGVCAPLIQSGNNADCPLPCSMHTQCGNCLAHPHCGRCAEDDESQGQGLCMEGSRTQPHMGTCGGNSSVIEANTTNNNITNIEYTWHFMECPLENECNTSHHSCDLEREDCVDLELGHHCPCKDGYKLIDGECIPQCNPNCENGKCVKPQVCECNFSWVGDQCSIPCLCNQHSDCLGPNDTTTCLECKNNTIGDQCQYCDKLSVGDAVENGVCESCTTVCNRHADVCMADAMRQMLILQPNQTIAETYLELVTHGPISHSDVICIDCANNTAGSTCDTCESGYFRRNADPSKACTKCLCNGHSSICNENTGSNCDCKNNTMSPCQTDDNCYQQQCNQCKEYYVGSPVDGHQCYLKLSSDITFCITRSQVAQSESSVECAKQTEPLPQGQAVMFAVLPKYLNVDINIYVNIEFGEADIYVGKFEDMFVINWDADTNQHAVTLNGKYNVDNVERKKRNVQEGRVKRSTDNSTYNLVKYQVDPTLRSNFIHASPTPGYFDSVYHILGAESRVVITLPELHHNLRIDKFYIVLVSKSANTSGIVLFRQDQIRIELFVFFAVFFSCFFKFLSVCVIVWKMKSLYNQQQQRIQRAVELDQMASRPFGSLLIHFEQEADAGDTDAAPLCNKKHDFQINPAACEFTDDGVAVVATVIFEMPGGKEAPARALFGTSLVTLRVLYPNRKAVTERHKDASSGQRTTQT